MRRHVGLVTEYRERQLGFEAERIFELDLVNLDILGTVDTRIDLVDLLGRRHDAAQLQFPAVRKLLFHV